MNTLLENINKIHTTELGKIRIEKNLKLQNIDAVEYCKEIILKPTSNIKRQGKNFYIENNDVIITVNAYSYTIITAHKGKR